MEALTHHRSMSRISDLSATLEVEEERPVRCGKFRRQELWAYKPVWSPLVVATMYSVVAVILIPLGVVVLVQSSKLMSTSLLRYDHIAQCNATNLIQNRIANATDVPSQKCILAINITRRTTGPVYMYYGLVNYFQNARRYTRSRSAEQLMGKTVKNSVLEKTCLPCKGGSCNTDLYPTGSSATSKAFNPCGLTARSQFNDTFKLCRDKMCENEVNVTGKGISWDIDRRLNFKPNKANTPEQNARITSEDFMVWMRLAAYRRWHKLYRRVLEPLDARMYYVHVESNYPVRSFNGMKYIYITETTWFGGPNQLLGIGCIAIGCLSLLLALLYGVRSRFVPEPKLPPQTEVPWKDVAQDSGGNRVDSNRPMS